MKLKTISLLLLFLCSISNVTWAQRVNIDAAKTVAKNHLESIKGQVLKSTISSPNTINFTSVIPEVINNDTLYYILNDTINKGFIIVSADQRAWPILAYSTEGSFNEKKQPEALVNWMDNRKKEIEYIKKNDIQPNSTTIDSWKNLSLKSSAKINASVEPLIKTQWDQGCYYNSKCPIDNAGQCGNAYTGCTATAMAQIMKFWNFPTKGKGTHSYHHWTYGTLSADFGSTTYQWDQMPDKLISENDAVATLMYHCGVALEMDYGTSVSSAWDPRDELVKYFNYSSKAVMVNRDVFSTSDWINILKSELDLGHPIYYQGGGSVGHAFICDGYQGEEYFHFNWGWNGDYDGYYYLGSLNPGWHNFSTNHSIIMNLVPGDLPDGYDGLFLSSNQLDVATKGDTVSIDVCSSINWTVSTDQSWLALSTNAGNTGKTTLTITASENQSENDRSATVILSAVGYNDQIITINQNTAIDVTPNSLYNSVAEKAVSITKLKLTGSIDARDFKTMRDAMPRLTDVDLSDVTIIEYSGTEGTVYGNDVIYPENTIPEEAFMKASCNGDVLLKSIVLPSSTASIGSFAFGNCKYLSAVNIPSSVINIGERAFNACSSLINVNSNNPYYSSIDGVLFNKEQTELLQCPTSKNGTYTVPSSVVTIGSYAFENCIRITSVIIPSPVSKIKTWAFANCNNITDVSIPSSVSSIEENPFFHCSALINVDSNNPYYSSIDGVLFNKEQTELLQCPTSKTGTYTISSSVTSIGESAFSGCSMLTNVDIPPTVKSIRYGTFGYCTGLTAITIPESVVSIEPASFASCYSLNTVSIPSSVSSIGSHIFMDCKKIFSIYAHPIFPVDLTPSYGVFGLVDKTKCTLYVPYGSKAAYSEAVQWKDFTNIVELPNQVPIANAGIDKTVYENSVFTLDGTDSFDPESMELTYLWTSPVEFSSNSDNDPKPNYTAPEVTKDTTYAFSLVVNDGTIDSPADTIFVTVQNEINTGIHEKNDFNKFFVYPNPTTGLFEISIEGSQEQNYTIEVYNGFGQLKIAAGKVSRIDLSSFSNGVYFIKLITETKSYIQKIIKK